MKWAWLLGLLCATELGGSEERVIANRGLKVQPDPATGLPAQIETRVGESSRRWLTGPVRLAVSNEVTSAIAGLGRKPNPGWERRDGALVTRANLEGVPLEVVQSWPRPPRGSEAVVWDLDFRGTERRVAHTVTLELPLLDHALRIFTPTERGAIEVAAHPTFEGLPYGAIGWETGRAWVLPLVSIMDPRTDHALTIALPADANIPHLQFGWRDAGTLRLTLAHRGMGGGRGSPLRLLFFGHPADYRATLGVYSEAFPSHFRPVLPRGPYEGTFWYHHIHDYPAPDEMARQNVRFLWSSFWFTHLGEYLPAAREWEPYTYAKWWKLGQTMSDARIRAFVRRMHDLGIGTYAYFNVTEYGGAGGKTGDTAEAARILRERFADALVKDARGQDIPTWEGAMAMNPGGGYSLWPFLDDQVRRHLERLPDIDGFVIDRLDWASQLDYAHDDGLTMIGERPVENLAVPVGEAIRNVAALAHAAGKRVFVNQFYRVEVLRDVDGVCHENDYLPALGYLVPLRPASAWHHRTSYQGDLLAFEAQLKRRLQWALFPQMIAHEFPISQQPPNPRAADFLELYAPLFGALEGKRQVLQPHCVEVTGASDVNLFINRAGHYVVPVTSRTRFLSRPGSGTETVVVTLRLPGAGKLDWGYALSADGAAYAVPLAKERGEVRLTVDRHGTATVLVAGKGPVPELAPLDAPTHARLRDALRADPWPPLARSGRPGIPASGPFRLRLRGVHLGVAGTLSVQIDAATVGRLEGPEHRAQFDWAPSRPLEAPPRVTLVAADEGTWFLPERVELLAPRPDGGARQLAGWQLGMALSSDASATRLTLPLESSELEFPGTSARFAGRDPASGGRWHARVGRTAVWIPGRTSSEAAQSGFRLELVDGQPFEWPAASSPDPRVLEARAGASAAPTCWFRDDHLRLRLVPPDTSAYRLTLFVLDYDRNGRALDVVLSDEFTALDTKPVSVAETAEGVYLTWTVGGTVNVELQKRAGHNVVLSGVFVDPAAEPGKPE